MGGTTAPGLGAGAYAGVQVSNASCVKDLGGPFGNGGGSIEGNGATGFVGNSNGKLVTGGTFFGGVGAGVQTTASVSETKTAALGSCGEGGSQWVGTNSK